MFKKFLKLSAMAAAVQASTKDAAKTDPKDHWAVIVVGSKGYENYRHHADGCHAYQIALKNGVPEDQIITIAYDDVANSYSNPFKGKLFNKPTADGVAGVDVYEGCKIDYKGRQANKKNILGVLQGDTSIGGKVLKSDENSKVFFYFADHGAPGFVALPTGWFSNNKLYADDLHKAVTYMHENKMYKEMTMYVEACESGSMFEKVLEDNINVYAVSAANSHESSWGTYCSPDDKVDGKHIGSCLGDLFSVNWMEDADAAKMAVETLQNQYQTVQKKTTKSHVLQWGQLNITTEPIGEFESGNYTAPSDFWDGMHEVGRNLFNTFHMDQATQKKNDFAVDTRDIKLHYLYTNVLNDPSHEKQTALKNELEHRLTVDRVFQEAAPKLLQDIKDGTVNTIPTDFDCYRDLVDNFEKQCGMADPYTFKYFKVFVAQCDIITHYAPAADGFKTSIVDSCHKHGMKPDEIPEDVEEHEL